MHPELNFAVLAGVANRELLKSLRLLAKNRQPTSEYAQPDPRARHAVYGAVLNDKLRQFQGRGLPLRVPLQQGLRSRGWRPFHATPELFCQLVGTTVFDMPEERFALKSGEVCLMPRGMPHGETVHDVPGAYLTLIVMLWPDGFSLHFGHASAAGSVLSDTHDRFRAGYSLLPRHLDEVARGFHAKDAAARDYVRGLLVVVFAEMLRTVRAPDEAVDPLPPLVAGCLDLIQLELGEIELSVTMLAGRLGCSADHLSRLYRQKTGCSVSETINQARIEHACALLENLKLSAGEVAWMSGFSSQSYFNQVFLSRTGMTPGQYRSAKVSPRRFASGGILARLSAVAGRR